MKSLFTVIVAAFLIIGITSCDRYDGLTRASVYDTGNLSNEGCGYLFKMQDGSFQMPETMPSAFRHNGQEVWVKLTPTGNSVICKVDQTNKKSYELMKIEEIQRYLE